MNDGVQIPIEDAEAILAGRLVLSDGGRAAAGFATATDAGDCVVRAIAIADEADYRETYEALARFAESMGEKRSARDGLAKKVYKGWLAEQGWTWTATMTIGSGCRVHLRADELPAGRLVVALSKHLCAVIDGVIFDNHDPSRDGTRCVYGYWSRP